MQECVAHIMYRSFAFNDFCCVWAIVEDSWNWLQGPGSHYASAWFSVFYRTSKTHDPRPFAFHSVPGQAYHHLNKEKQLPPSVYKHSVLLQIGWSSLMPHTLSGTWVAVHRSVCSRTTVAWRSQSQRCILTTGTAQYTWLLLVKRSVGCPYSIARCIQNLLQKPDS